LKLRFLKHTVDVGPIEGVLDADAPFPPPLAGGGENVTDGFNADFVVILSVPLAAAEVDGAERPAPLAPPVPVVGLVVRNFFLAGGLPPRVGRLIRGGLLPDEDLDDTEDTSPVEALLRDDLDAPVRVVPPYAIAFAAREPALKKALSFRMNKASPSTVIPSSL
jgi:hypothetical protein